YHTVVSVEQVAFAIAFEDFAKHPAVTVRIAKLDVLQLAIEFRRARRLQEIQLRPESSQTRAFGILVELATLFLLCRIMLLLGVHLVAMTLVVLPRHTPIVC